MIIDSYKFGKISVDGVEYEQDLIILPDKIITNWWREKGHIFSLNDCHEIISAKPDFIVFGLGAYRVARLSKDLIGELEASGIAYAALGSKAACSIFNKKAGGNVAGAFHLTC